MAPLLGDAPEDLPLAQHAALRRMLIAAALAGVLAVAGCGGGSEEDETGGVPESGTVPSTTTTEPTATSGATSTTTDTTEPATSLPAGVEALITIDVQGDNVSVSAVVSGNNPTFERTVQVGVNTPVRIQVTADRPEEAHLHGYDLTADLEPGVPAVIDFVASTPGLFLIELEDSHLLLAQLEVAA
ncbi:MAG: hypothetical protein ACRD0A_09150 [Acidimicrobiales bacterium]